jgi:hypothetical protein
MPDPLKGDYRMDPATTKRRYPVMKIDWKAWAIFAAILILIAAVYFWQMPFGEPEVQDTFSKIQPLE